MRPAFGVSMAKRQRYEVYIGCNGSISATLLADGPEDALNRFTARLAHAGVNFSHTSRGIRFCVIDEVGGETRSITNKDTGDEWDADAGTFPWERD